MKHRIKIGYFVFFGLIAGLTLVYLAGPANKLGRLSRLHYNALFLLTPCLGPSAAYDDGAVAFSYKVPPDMVNRQEPAFWDLFSRAGSRLAGWENLNVRLSPSYRFKAPAGKDLAAIVAAASPQVVKVSGGDALMTTEGVFGGSGDLKFLYVMGKNGYVYRLAMPRYPAREESGSWVRRALESTPLLEVVSTDMPRSRGFLYWFLTPSAEKQAYCSARTTLKTLALK